MLLFRPTVKNSFIPAIIAGAAMAGIFLLGMEPAMAQSKDFAQVQKGISGQIVFIPRLIAIIAYVIAAFFAATGLLKLKDWINEPEKNPLQAVIFRMVVASLLIVLPHILIIVNNTLFGTNKSGGTDVDISVPMQSLNAFGNEK